MKKFAKFIGILIATVLTISVMIIPAAADTTKAPYVRSWLDAMSNYMVIDYYEYSASNQAYWKTSTINYVGANAYYKTISAKLSDSLFDEQIGFDVNGNILFINTDRNVYGVLRNTNTAQTIGANADELAYDKDGFVIGYYSNNNLINLASPNSTGNTASNSTSWNAGSSNTNTGSNNSWNTGSNNSWNTGSNNSWNASSSSTNTGSNNSWNTGSGNTNTGSNNSWNTGSSNTNANYNLNSPTGSFPYIAIEDGNMVYVEATDLENVLYIEDNHLIINNIILYKHGVKYYGFSKDGVVYITSANKLVVWKFNTKKQYVIASKVANLNTDNYGFVVGYTTSAGKSISL